MIYTIYSIRDRKGEFWSPRIDINDPSAIRNFSMMVNNPGGVMEFAPADFDLYVIGKFDASNGVIDPLPIPELVVEGLSVVGAKYEK